MGPVEIINIKNKLLKLGIQIEDSIKKTTKEDVKQSRKETLNTIHDTLDVISELQMSLARSTIKAEKLEAYIEDITKQKRLK